MGRERRKHFRVGWNSPAAIYDGQLPRRCIVSNFSNGGAKIVGVMAMTFSDEFMLRITPGHGRMRKCRVLWRSDDAIRVQFTDRIASVEESSVRKQLVGARQGDHAAAVL